MFNTVGTRPAFGMQQPGFGFGAAASTTPFGQTQNFMSGTPNTGFNQNTGGFGSTAPMFGGMANTQPSTNLFGNPSTSTFGAGQTGFGNSIFGSNQQQQQPSTSGIFGSTAPTFGQQNKSTGFGFGQSQTQTTGLFGQAQPSQSTSLFQPSTSTNVFGTPAAFGSSSQSGTVFKFVPVTGTDSMQKSGIAQTISTKHHCITCMKEYEGKSLEELRWEDYQASRRGPQQGGFSTQTPFGGAASTQSLFGQTENKQPFQSTSFQTPAFGLPSQSNANQNMFGRSNFGATATTTTPFGFGTNTSTNSLFGSNQQNKFGQAPAFGQQQPTNTAFGTTTNIFAQNTTQNKGLFSTPTQPSVFGQPQQPQQQQPQAQNSFGFGQAVVVQTPSIFGAPKTTAGFFGNTTTSTPSFGQPQFSFGSFGGNNFNKPPQNTFGQPIGTLPFGSNLNVQGGNNFFNNAQKQTPLFGTMNTGGGLFNNNLFQQPNSFSFPMQQQAQQMMQQPIIEPPLQSLLQLTDPYGIQKCLEGLTPKKPGEITYATNPQEIQKILESPKSVRPPSLENQRKPRVYASSSRTNIFENVFEDSDQSQYSFKNTPKRLVLSLEKKDSPELLPEHLKLDFEENDQEVSPARMTISRDLNPPKDDTQVLEEVTQSETLNADSKSTSGTYSFKDAESFGSSGSDEAPQIPLNFDINKTLKEITKYDAFEIDDFRAPLGAGKAPEVTSQNVNATGVICTRSDYYTIPPLHDLHKFINSEGRCIVTGLVIGRIGYGNVFYSTPVDLTNVNIDELVHFCSRELTIYPDNTNKPEFGQGLNQPAQVTLDGVWPKDRDGETVIRDIDFLLAINFTEVLKKACRKHETKFVDYRPDTGSWVFKAPHFSKYGFTDSDDEEATMYLEQYKAQQREKQKQMEAAAREERRRLAMDISEGATGTDVERGQPETEMLRRTLSASKSIDSQLSFDFAGLRTTNNLQQSQKMKTLFDYDMYDISHSEGHMMVEKGCQAMGTKAVAASKPLLLRKQGRQKATMDFLRNMSGRVPLRYSLLNHRNYCDMAIFKGRSFKVGWGKGFVYTNISHQTAGYRPRSFRDLNARDAEYDIGRIKTDRHIHLTKIEFLSDDLNRPFKEKMVEYLEAAFKGSKMIGNSYIPLYASNSKATRGALKEFIELAIYAFNVDRSKFCVYVLNVWCLVAALWGKLLDEPMTRKDLFSIWLENVTEDDFLSTMEDIPLSQSVKRILLCMACHRIVDAATVARRSRMPQVSVLLSQINGSEYTKGMINLQLEQWLQTGIIDYMNPEVLKLYLLLAGQPLYGRVNVCDTLPWQKALGMHLWYFTSPTDSLELALAMYEHAFEGDYQYSSYPEPPYTIDYFDHYDMQFHIMKLYVEPNNSLETVLNTFTHTSDPTDYRLSWLIMHSLIGLGVGRITENAKNHLHTNFAVQLENMGLYKWAVFVLMFINDVTVRMNLVRQVLERNLLEWDGTKIEDELVCDFKIPAKFLHAIKASKTDVVPNHWSMYKHLLYSEDWNLVHDVLSKEILPRAFINEFYDLIEKILIELDPMAYKIKDWDLRGGAFLDFVRTRKALVVNKHIETKEDARKLRAIIRAVLNNMRYYHPKTAVQYVCHAEMVKHTMAYFKTVHEIIGTGFRQVYAEVDDFMDDFEVPIDYLIDEALDTIDRFYYKTD